MGRYARTLSGAVAALYLVGCSHPVRTVEVQVPVPIPGPIQYRPIPQDLLRCDGRPAELEDGITGGELLAGARSWQTYAECIESKLAEIARLPAVSSGPSTPASHP